MSEFPWLPDHKPSNWERCEIQSFCTVVRGGSPRPKGSPLYFGGDIPFVKISDVTASDGRTLRHTADSVNEDGATKSRLIGSGRLILSNSGTVCVPIFLGFDACIHDGFVAFDALPQEIRQDFLYHFFNYIRPFILTKHKQGVTQVNLNTGIVSEIQIDVPPLNEQRRIVDKIEQLFDLLDKGEESLRAARDKAGLYRQSLLKHAFEGHLTADWRTANPDKLEAPETLLTRIQEERDARYKQALDDWQDALAKWRAEGEEGKKPAKPQRPKGVDEIKPEELSNLAGLPDSWAYVRLGEFVYRIDAGKSFKCDESEPVGDQIGVAKVSAVSWGAYDESESKTCVDPSKVNPDYFIVDGDFILSRANTIELVGACVIVNKVTRSVMLSDKTLRIDFLADDRRIFLHYLRSATGRSEIEKRSTGNQESMRNIGQDRIRSIIFPLSSHAEQAEIVSRLEAKLSTLDALEADIDAQLARSRALRQSILKRAFEGKLVPQDPTDEPASALLARIKAERDAAPKPKRKRKAKA